MKTVEPTRDQVLAFCAQDPVERVFLEDVARRGLGRFLAVADDGRRAERRCVTPVRTSCRRAPVAGPSPTRPETLVRE